MTTPVLETRHVSRDYTVGGGMFGSRRIIHASRPGRKALAGLLVPLIRIRESTTAPRSISSRWISASIASIFWRSSTRACVSFAGADIGYGPFRELVARGVKGADS